MNTTKQKRLLEKLKSLQYTQAYAEDLSQSEKAIAEQLVVKGSVKVDHGSWSGKKIYVMVLVV